MTKMDHKIVKTSYDGDAVSVEWDGGALAKFDNIWLRDNCHCSECYYDATKQRLLNSCSIPDDIAPIKVDSSPTKLKIVWNHEEHQSEYECRWLVIHSYNPRQIPVTEKVSGEREILAREYWTVKDMEGRLPSVDFKTVMASTDENEEPIKDWCLKIWKHGFCFIDNVPVDPQETEKLCEKLMYIRPTHYGGFWDFTSDLSKNDTAYTNIDISSHTDGTYWSDTPGLQLFQLLTRIPVPAHSAGEEKVCIQPDIPQPIFKLDTNGELIQVRWNQSDRSTMDSWENPLEVVKFYRAIKQWHKIISDPANELFYQLRPGQCLIFDNWRCFHSRTEFTGKRRMCGAYINRDDFVSRLKLLNIGRQPVLDAI